MDLTFNARFGTGGLLQGGLSTGQTVFNNCFVVDSPQTLSIVTGFGPADQQIQFCEFKLPFRAQTQFKAAAVYPGPWGIQVSGVLQNMPGVPQNAVYPAPSALVAPSLGRPLAAGGVAVVTLIEPNTQFEDRLSQLDLRFTKILRFGHGRLQAAADVYNVFNARTVLSSNATFGPTWLRPSSILGGRMLKLGAQFDY
jgi:hypothetical protein